MDPPDLPEEAVWLRRVADGDESAFVKLIEKHQDRVYGTVVRMLGRDYLSEAEDVAQQVFLRVFRAAGKYRPDAKFTTWLFTICRNCVLTHLKRTGRWLRDEPLVNEAGEDVDPLDHLPDPGAVDAASGLLRKEMVEALEGAIAELPESQRMALILRQYEQLDYEEIAGVLNQTVPGVKSLLFRARTRLRAVLEEYLHAG